MTIILDPRTVISDPMTIILDPRTVIPDSMIADLCWVHLSDPIHTGKPHKINNISIESALTGLTGVVHRHVFGVVGTGVLQPQPV